MRFSPSHSVCGSPEAMCGLWGGECGGDCRKGVKCGVGGQKEGAAVGDGGNPEGTSGPGSPKGPVGDSAGGWL